ncbi:hypothetical protein EYF80_027586 [Liparis tanakae]|uniref:Uncharacterized protein n=1 Tax=Liparis tanakae TaxID=230148 RepID=A0A4Z2H8V0_9TELE|nr:hypothetical protein EYF80_027586 [Liparis tanakae]
MNQPQSERPVGGASASSLLNEFNECSFSSMSGFSSSNILLKSTTNSAAFISISNTQNKLRQALLLSYGSPSRFLLLKMFENKAERVAAEGGGVNAAHSPLCEGGADAGSAVHVGFCHTDMGHWQTATSVIKPWTVRLNGTTKHWSCHFHLEVRSRDFLQTPGQDALVQRFLFYPDGRVEAETPPVLATQHVLAELGRVHAAAARRRHAEAFLEQTLQDLRRRGQKGGTLPWPRWRCVDILAFSKRGDVGDGRDVAPLSQKFPSSPQNWSASSPCLPSPVGCSPDLLLASRSLPTMHCRLIVSLLGPKRHAEKPPKSAGGSEEHSGGVCLALSLLPPGAGLMERPCDA